jgi:aryl-alcohol dehydrogenase-like predicted oxidoreductase
MEYAFLGDTGVRVSRLGLGTMAFGAEADEPTAGVLFRAARDAGVNFFDTADVYAKGRSEEILGRLVQGCRDEVVLATKAYFPTSKDPNARGASRYHLVRAVEASLKRLATDRVDILFLHRFDDQTSLEDTLRGVEHLVQQGKVLYPAVSNYAAWQAARALGVAERHGWARIVALQPMYNLAKRTAEVEILPMALAERLAVFPYSPLGGGLFSGKYDEGARPASGRLVKNAMYKVRYGDEAVFDLATRFSRLARDAGHHPATLAIAWVAAHPAVTAPLVGGRNLEQLEVALAAANVTMTAELYDAIGALAPAPPPATDRNEERSEHNFGAR